jgi:hypothetical protein
MKRYLNGKPKNSTKECNKRHFLDIENKSKRRLYELNKKPHYLENPYNLDTTWDWKELKIVLIN